MSKKKPYSLSAVEEGIQNPDYAGFSGGRIEVYKEGVSYAAYEFRFLLPTEVWIKLREVLDFTDWTKEEFEKSYLEFDGRKVAALLKERVREKKEAKKE